MDRKIKLLLIVGSVILASLVVIVVLCVHFIRKPTLSLTFEPAPSKGAFIYLNFRDRDNINQWTSRLDDFLKPYYHETGQSTNLKYCEQGIPPKQNSDEVCDVDVTHWHPCVRDTKYGYTSIKGPCIFLIFNQSPEWLPEYYNSSTVPNNMPQYLKEHINKVESKDGVNSTRLRVVWVSCEGETPVDLEAIGPLQFMPSFGFDGQYFPVIAKEGYLKPLVAVHFEKPIYSIVIDVVCKAWARNIDHKKGQGIVRLALLFDD
ncbi:hypothetical protein ILUMI_00347 [Ignelater luminosus]|uniref:Sodium/potassium-transporting ATPase subunit beta-2 n=1 Tax=Ignelater luminosus TaxID=2038154 RepID=A0A8K0DM28_IGNLU|nr:hypothetical protein ILUMI_00347 [Ignelater luminosus]